MALTKRQIDQLTYDPNGAKTQVHYDGGNVPGFGVAVTPTGIKTFILKYRPVGSAIPRRLTIGRYGALTLDQARKIARDELYAARKGDDPVERKRVARLEEKRGITVKDFAPIYIENAKTKGNPGRKRRPKKTWKEDERRLNKYVVPKWGKRRLTDITTQDVRRLHNGIEARYEANRVLALVSVMFEAARMLGYYEEHAPNPTKGVIPFEEQSRDRFVTRQEMPALIEAIQAEDNPHLRAALQWDAVDLDRRVIRLGDTKAGRPHHVPLSAPAVEILSNLPRLLGNPYVVPSPVQPGKPINAHSFKKVWNRVRARLWLAMNPEKEPRLRAQAVRDVERYPKHSGRGKEAVAARLLKLALEQAKAGDDRLTLHDLRRTVGSWMVLGGASLPLVGKVLNHSNPSTTQVYARLQDEATRQALEEHGAKIAAIVNGGGA